MPNWALRKSLKEVLLLCRVKNVVTVVCVLYGLLYVHVSRGFCLLHTLYPHLKIAFTLYLCFVLARARVCMCICVCVCTCMHA